jgi:hypothetical protein
MRPQGVGHKQFASWQHQLNWVPGWGACQKFRGSYHKKLGSIPFYEWVSLGPELMLTGARLHSLCYFQIWLKPHRSALCLCPNQYWPRARSLAVFGYVVDAGPVLTWQECWLGREGMNISWPWSIETSLTYRSALGLLVKSVKFFLWSHLYIRHVAKPKHYTSGTTTVVIFCGTLQIELVFITAYGIG